LKCGTLHQICDTCERWPHVFGGLHGKQRSGDCREPVIFHDFPQPGIRRRRSGAGICDDITGRRRPRRHSTNCSTRFPAMALDLLPDNHPDVAPEIACFLQIHRVGAKAETGRGLNGAAVRSCVCVICCVPLAAHSSAKARGSHGKSGTARSRSGISPCPSVLPAVTPPNAHPAFQAGLPQGVSEYLQKLTPHPNCVFKTKWLSAPHQTAPKPVPSPLNCLTPSAIHPAQFPARSRADQPPVGRPSRTIGSAHRPTTSRTTEALPRAKQQLQRVDRHDLVAVEAVEGSDW